MIKERARLLAIGIFSLDLALIAIAFWLAYWFRSVFLPTSWPNLFHGELYPLQDYLPFLPIALVIWGG
ncbi:MAG: hypothetical protein K0U98_09225, partial [Deltaproteobacteria bacterium]|nr:hypothetical protein [Deltaproteobacteria bacterium]